MKRKQKRVFSGFLAMIMLVLVWQVPASAANAELKLNTPMTVTPLDESVKVSFKPEESGHYTFASESDEGSDPLLYKISDATGESVELIVGDEDDYDYPDLDFRAVYLLSAGETYTLQLKDYSGTIAVNGFQLTVTKSEGILHQPTWEEPYVTVSAFDSVKSYQWHEVTYVSEKVTNQNATALDTDFGKSSYDSTTEVWTTIDTNQNCYDVVEMELKAGTSYCVEVMDDSAEFYKMVFVKEGMEMYAFNQGDDGKYYVTVDDNTSAELRVYLENDYSKALKIKITKESPISGDKVTGQTTSTLTDFEEGKEYLCVVEYADGTKLESSLVMMYYTITHEPTAKEPYVSVNNERGAFYQWYKIKQEWTTLTIDDAYEVWNDENSSESYYDSDTGKWYGDANKIDDTDTYRHLYLKVQLFEGQKVTVEFDEEPIDCRLYQSQYYDGTTVSKDGKKYTFTAEETSGYTLMAICATDSNPVKAVYTEWELGDKVEGQTTDTLTSYDRDTWYTCQVSYENGTELQTSYFTIEPQFLRQPTVEKPSVEVTYPNDVTSYQWYEMQETQIAITDENAMPMYSDSSKAEYDSTTGTWSSLCYDAEDGEYMHQYFLIVLQAGDVLTIEASDTPTQDSVLAPYYGMFGEVTDTKIEGNQIQFTVGEAAEYVVVLYTEAENTTIKAFKNGYKLGEKLEGQTGTAITKVEKDKVYACVVTYQDNLSLTSDAFKATQTIDYSKVTPNVPATGDYGALAMWFVLLLVSGAGLIVLGYDRRRRYNR